MEFNALSGIKEAKQVPAVDLFEQTTGRKPVSETTYKQEEVVSKDWLGSVDLASYTLFALKEDMFTSIVENAKSYLLDVLERSTRQRRTLSPRVISALFGLSFTNTKFDNFFYAALAIFA